MKRVVLLLGVIMLFIGCGNRVDKVRGKMEKHLYDKYGEEFVVDTIGTRNANGDKYYQARIYPKSIIGTSKIGDKYYRATATLDINKVGMLEKKAGDTYGKVKIREEAEKYLLEKVKKIFGDRVLIKVEPELKVKKEKYDYFLGYILPGFEDAMNRVKKDPENKRLELELYIYIFDRIDDDVEKEERRKQIFEFVQYLKSEGLFEYLEMGVIFIDERVLAPSYDIYSWEVENSIKEEVVIEGEKVYLPPMKFRVEMSDVLGKELEEMREEELVESMEKIRKSELIYKGINRDNAQSSSYVYSSKLLKTKYLTALEKGILEDKDYENKISVEIEKELECIYID